MVKNTVKQGQVVSRERLKVLHPMLQSQTKRGGAGAEAVLVDLHGPRLHQSHRSDHAKGMATDW